MDSALGVPKELAEKDRGELTPMMCQYVDLCGEYDSELLLFHVGDFYKAFGEAGRTVARLCELNLTTREDNSGEYEMAGLRRENAETHLQTLLEAGYRVAIAEQVEEPSQVSGVADRKVTRVITPGTVTENELLESSENNFVMTIAREPTTRDTPKPGREESQYGLAFLDVSTGAFYTTTVESINQLGDEVSRISPEELIFAPEMREMEETIDHIDSQIETRTTRYDSSAFDESEARKLIQTYFGQLQGSIMPSAEVRAAGALLAYAEYTRSGENEHLEYITEIERYDPTHYMELDDVALRGLEIFDRRADQSPEGATLVDVVDDSVSALGSRKIHEWLRRPLQTPDQIEDRLNAVEELLKASFTRDTIRDLLSRVYDIERLTSQISRGRADARDLRALHESLGVIPQIETELEEVKSNRLTTIKDELPELNNLIQNIDSAVQEDPATELTKGGIIRTGYDKRLDDLRATVRDNREWIEDLEEREKARTGIDNLRVGHTDVHGYYIEVTESHLDKVPDDYTRRQTLKSAERFYTPELKEREEEIITAERRANELEYKLFCHLRNEIAGKVDTLKRVAEQLAVLDALVTFAEVAAHNQYTRPEIRPAGSGLTIEKGRHPVVEETQEEFVPNDTHLHPERCFAVITGPNMSGKSTYLRQVALITILAQCGSFVPAATAQIGVIDRIFTRIGASDDITGGRSTFMVEMTEVSEILKTATKDSLVLLDEVGRGTSTADGYALARAVTEYLYSTVGATTLFATHHHALTEVVENLQGAFNLHFDAKRTGDGVTFPYEISEGAATASYGVEVARKAGVPDEVLENAIRVLAAENNEDRRNNDEIRNDGDEIKRDLSQSERTNQIDEELLEFIEEYDSQSVITILRTVRNIDINRTPPVEALSQLSELQNTLKEE